MLVISYGFGHSYEAAQKKEGSILNPFVGNGMEPFLFLLYRLADTVNEVDRSFPIRYLIVCITIDGIDVLTIMMSV